MAPPAWRNDCAAKLRDEALHALRDADGKSVLTSGSDRVLRFWDMATGRQSRIVKLQGKAGPCRLVTLSPDGKLLAAQGNDGLVLWEVDSGKELL